MSLLDRHLDALEAQLKLALVQIAGIRQHLVTVAAAAPAAVSEPKVETRPERCHGVPRAMCGLVTDDEEARASMANFADLKAWQCRGCRFKSYAAPAVEGQAAAT